MNIFITKLNPTTSEDDLFNLFKRYGRVISVKLVTDRDSGLSKGIAYIDMEDEMEARSAINALNGSEFQGNLLVMKVARPKEEGAERRKPDGVGRRKSIGGDRRNSISGARRKPTGGEKRKPFGGARRSPSSGDKRKPRDSNSRPGSLERTPRKKNFQSALSPTSNRSSSHRPGARHTTSNRSTES